MSSGSISLLSLSITAIKKYTPIAVLSFLLFGINTYLYSSSLFHILDSNTDSLQLAFILDHYNIDQVETEQEIYHRLSHPESGYIIEQGLPELPSFSVLLAIPSTGSVTIENCEIEREHYRDNITIFPAQNLDIDYPVDSSLIKNVSFYEKGSVYPDAVASLSQPMIMRHQRLVSLTINPFAYNPSTKQLTVKEELEIVIRFNQERIGENEIAGDQTNISRTFDNFLSSSVINYNHMRSTHRTYQSPSLLVIYHHDPSIASIVNEYLDWKRDKGFEVHSVDTSNLTNAVQIKSYIQNAYDTWDNPPEYIVIIGSGTGTLAVPYWSGEGDSDHPYGLLAGNDDIWDVFVGRIWAENSYQLATLWNKIQHYEIFPNLDNTDWYEHNLLVGDPTVSGISTVITNRWIRELMLRYNDGYSFSEVYSPPFPSQINNAINQGSAFFNYRGFGGMSGWSPDTGILNNTNKLCNSVILTCGTLSYIGSSTVSNLLTLGTPINAKGSISGIGMSTSSTHTAFNNCLGGGIFYSIFVEGRRTMGEALARGKLNLWQHYGSSYTSFAFLFSRWANLFGDPSLDIWVESPKPMDVTYDTVIPPGSNYIVVSVTDEQGVPLDDVWITVRQVDDADNEFFNTDFTDDNGSLYLAIDAEVEGQIKLTATKSDYIPHHGSFTIEGTEALSFHELLLTEDLVAGNTVDFNISIKNYQTNNVQGITGTISSDDDYITIIDDTASFGDILAGEVAESLTPYIVSIDPATPADYEIEVFLTISDASANAWNGLFQLNIQNGIVSLVTWSINDGDNGILDPGEQASLLIEVTNNGTVDLDDIYSTLRVYDYGLSIVDSISFFGDINTEGIVDNSEDSFSLSAIGNVIPGMSYIIEIDFYNNLGFFQTSSFTVEVGQSTINDPLGPDAYGYWVYDEGDSTYAFAPSYDWIEICPQLGGNGVDTNLQADFDNIQEVMSMDLPFNFRFYGLDYNVISICANGWMAFGVTEQASQRNWHLPAPLAPASIIAAFWDNLSLAQGGVYTFYDSVENTFIIQWQNAQNVYEMAEETFQIILYDPVHHITQTGDGLIKIQYKVFNNVNNSTGSPNGEWGNYSTIGIADHTSTIGLEYTYNNVYPPTATPLCDESAILFVPSWLDLSNTFVNLDSFELYAHETNIPNYGETISFVLNLSNIGGQMAEGLTGIISSENPYITILNDTANFGDIDANSSIIVQDAFSVLIDYSIPNMHTVNFQLVIQSADNMNWVNMFSFDVAAPQINIEEVLISDNNNNIPQNGEEIYIQITLNNTGAADAFDLSGLLSSTDPYVIIDDNIVPYPDLPSGEVSLPDDFISLQISDDTPHQYTPSLILNIESEVGITWELPFSFTVAAPLVEIEEVSITDNNNNIPEYDETIYFQLALENNGGNIASEVSAILDSEDEYVTIIADELNYGTILTGQSITPSESFIVEIADNIPDMHQIVFEITVTTADNHIWLYEIEVPINAPELVCQAPIIYDAYSNGNNNGLLDPGEEIILYVPIFNSGTATSPSIFFDLSCDNPYVVIDNINETQFNQLDSESFFYAEIHLMAGEELTPGTVVSFNYILESGNYSFIGQISTVAVGLSGQIGGGPETNNNTEACPINIFYRSLRDQMVYTASELQEAGLGLIGGFLITHIGFFIDSPPEYPLPDFIVRIKHTAASDATDHDFGPYITVYNNDNYMPNVGDWDMLTLTTPFEWNGVDNILIDTAFSQTTNFHNSGQVRIFSSPGGYRYSRSDAHNQTNATTTNLSHYKPQIQFYISPNSEIIRPDSLTAQIFNDFIQLEWDSPSEESNLSDANSFVVSQDELLKDTIRTNRQPDGYKVYRNGICLTDELLTETSYLDHDIIPLSVYYYHVTAVYGTIESPTSNIVVVELSDITANPVFNPNAGYYNQNLLVSLSCMTGNAQIYFTMDGSEPDENTTLYTAPIELAIGTETLIKARAYSDTLLPSNIVSSIYYITETIPEPVIEPSSGLYTQPIEITLSLPDDLWNIYYTLDGSIPDENSYYYTGSFILQQSAILKARAFATGWEPSEISTAEYTILTPPLEISASASGYDITITWQSPYAIYSDKVNLYRNSIGSEEVNDIYPERRESNLKGSEICNSRQELVAFLLYRGFNDENDLEFLVELPVSENTYYDDNLIAGTYYYQMRSVYTDGLSDLSAMVSAQIPKVAKPSINPRYGTYYSPQSINISCTTPETVIFYTLDGTEPTMGSYQFNEPFIISEYTLVRARAFRTGWDSSNIAQEEYHILLTPDNLEGETSPGTVFLSWDYPITSRTPKNNEELNKVGLSRTEKNSKQVKRQENRLSSLKRINSREFIGYNVYRSIEGDDFEIINPSPVTNEEFVDHNLATGIYQYYVTSLYEIGESLPTDVISLNVMGVVCNPQFTPDPGDYWEPIEVNIYCCPSTATIFYTIDGSDPDINSEIFIDPIFIEDTTTIKAKGVLAGWFDSEIEEATYVIEQSVIEEEIIEPAESDCFTIYPNPFNPDVTISLYLDKAGLVDIEIFNISGRKIKSLISSHLPAGQYNFVWNGRNDSEETVSNGLYLIRLKTPAKIEIKKAIMIK